MPLDILKHIKHDLGTTSGLDPIQHIVQFGAMYGLPEWACTVTAVDNIRYSSFFFGCEMCGIQHEGKCAYEYTRELFYVLFFSQVSKEFGANNSNIIFFRHWLQMISKCGRDGWRGHIHFISRLQSKCSILPNRNKRKLGD
ncbi:uncharacterized protein KGF55_000094 [Candida pseudojiufengensis]|uniref:uncharacterized protein n=1 Tax=Candida pseudojiufengensis TaxID=497109 RepID=UPI002224849A|nr:uncharacterized protein KGF55_000094 [Candida pseudojiufengensis]KAI5967769.1 hypothetical protein KGF55_000094 [Candida pseudojiufengensis]